VAASLVDGAGELLTATAEGYVKRSLLSEYSAQGRNGGGIVAHKVSERTGPLVAACVLPAGALARDWAIFVTARGTAKPLQLTELPQMGRAGVGRPVVTTAEKDATSRIYYMASGDPNAPVDPAPGKRSSAPRPPAEQPELIDETPAPTPKRATPTQPVSGKVDLKPAAPATPAAKSPPPAPATAKETPRSAEPAAAPVGKRRTTLADQTPALPQPVEPASVATEPAVSEPEEPPQNAFDFLAEVPEKKPAPAVDAPKKAASNKLNAVVSVTKSMTEKKKK
jgi:DNA gyrase subunit A